LTSFCRVLLLEGQWGTSISIVFWEIWVKIGLLETYFMTRKIRKELSQAFDNERFEEVTRIYAKEYSAGTISCRIFSFHQISLVLQAP